MEEVALLQSAGRLMGIEANNLCGEKREQMLELLLGACKLG